MIIYFFSYQILSCLFFLNKTIKNKALISKEDHFLFYNTLYFIILATLLFSFSPYTYIYLPFSITTIDIIFNYKNKNTNTKAHKSLMNIFITISTNTIIIKSFYIISLHENFFILCTIILIFKLLFFNLHTKPLQLENNFKKELFPFFYILPEIIFFSYHYFYLTLTNLISLGEP